MNELICEISLTGRHTFIDDSTCLDCGYDRFQSSRCPSCLASYGHKRGCPTWARSEAEAIIFTIEQSKHFQTFLNPTEVDRIQARGLSLSI